MEFLEAAGRRAHLEGEPWTVTRSEFINAWLVEDYKRVMNEAPGPDDLSIWSKYCQAELSALAEIHDISVEMAIAEGKPVSAAAAALYREEYGLGEDN